MIELDHDAGGACLVDVLLGEADRRWAVGVLVDLAMEPLRLGELLGRLLAQPELVDRAGGELMQVGGEHLAVALAQRVTEDVAGVRDELARGPRVAVRVAVEVVDEDLEQRRADRPDRAKLINGGERDDSGPDELACLLGQLDADAAGAVTR